MKQFAKKLLALLLMVVLLTPVVTVTMPATEAQAASTYKITVSSVTTSAAKKVHNALMKGKKVIITYSRPKSSKTSADDFFDKFYGKVVDINKYHVGYHYYVSRDKYKNRKLVTTCTINASTSGVYSDEVKLRERATKEAVTTATDELAQKIHDTLSAKKEFVIFTKGKPDKIYKDLCEKVKKINRQGIRFKYESYDEYLLFDDIYQITINKDRATAYAYACKLSEKMFEHRKNGINERVLELYDPVTYYSTWPDWLHPAYDEDYDPEWCVPKCSKEEAYEQLRPAEKRIYDAQSMGELSDIVKLYVIDCYDLFAMGARGIIYESKESRWTSFKSDGVIMKHLYNDTARGVCMHYAKSEVILFSYFDIDVTECSDSDHAWTEGVAKDSYGNKISYKFDYELLTPGHGWGYYE